MDNIDEQNLPICCGACCTYGLFLSDKETCLGCVGKCELLCCGIPFCCKPGVPPVLCDKEYDQLCMLGCYLFGIYLQIPKTCLKTSSQCCCCVMRVAIPCDESMPCVANMCCLNVYPKVGCHLLFGEVENTGVCRCLSPSYKVAASG